MRSLGRCAFVSSPQTYTLPGEIALRYSGGASAPLLKWKNVDSIREQGGINLYGYVGASPINGVDPLGLVIHKVGDTGAIDRALDYLRRSPTIVAIIAYLESPDVNITIDTTGDGYMDGDSYNPFTGFNPFIGDVRWNPCLALSVPTRGCQNSPNLISLAFALGHELIHVKNGWIG